MVHDEKTIVTQTDELEWTVEVSGRNIGAAGCIGPVMVCQDEAVTNDLQLHDQIAIQTVCNIYVSQIL